MMNPNGVQALFVENDDNPEAFVKEDCDYIDNVTKNCFDSQSMEPSSTNLQIFAQYVKYIVEQFIDSFKDSFCCKLANTNLIIITPRVWGYCITEADVQTAIKESGITKETTVYNDINLYIQYNVQQFVNIGRLRTCLFCTFFVTPELTMESSTVTFFSGSVNYYESLIRNENHWVKPVNQRSLPSMSDSIDVVGLYTLFSELIKTKIEDRSIQIDKIVDNSLSRLVQFLKEKSMGEGSKDFDFEKLFPFRQAAFNNETTQKTGINGSSSHITTTALKDVSIRDIYNLFVPDSLQQFISAFQSTIQRLKAREVLLELFRAPHNVDPKYISMALVCAFFIHHALKQENDVYVHITFVNLMGDLDADFQTNEFWVTAYRVAVNSVQHSKNLSQFLNPSYITQKEHKTIQCNSRHPQDEDGMDFVIHLNLSLEKSKIYVLFKPRDYKSYKHYDCIDTIEPFGVLKEKYLKKCDSREKMTTKHLAVKRMFHSFTHHITRQDYEDFDVNDIQGQFHYQPKKLSTFDDILYAMHKIESHSQTPKHRIMFKHHKMKILFALYMMHMNEKLGPKKEGFRYVVLLDPYLNDTLGKKNTLIRYFAQEFGLFSRNEDVKKRMVVFKKRRAHTLKLQEDPIYQMIPLLQNFYHFQVTRKYCIIACNKVFLENERISSVEVFSTVFRFNFCDHVIENFWCQLEFVRSDGSLASFEAFKKQMNHYLDQLCLLKMGDDLDAVVHLNMDCGVVAEFTYRSVIETGIIPAIDKVVSFATASMASLADSLYKSWHTFITLENFNDMDIDLNSNMFHQLLKYEIKKKMDEFYRSNRHLDRSDYSIRSMTSADLCFVDKEPLGAYSLATGITHLHLTLNTTYGIRFSLEDGTTDGLSVYETGGFSRHKQQQERELDLDSIFIFAEAGEQVDYVGKIKRLRIQNDTGQAVYLGFFKVLESSVSKSDHEDDFDYQTIGAVNFAREFFDLEEYRACPIFELNIFHLINVPLLGIRIYTPSVKPLACQLYTQEPFTVLYV